MGRSRRSDWSDESPSPRELELKSVAVSAAAFGVALSAIAAGLLWVVFSFPIGPAGDLAGRVAAGVAGVEVCAAQLRTQTTPAPPGALTTSTTVIPGCTMPSPGPAAPTTARTDAAR